MTKPTIKIHNVSTDEIIEREMTDAEYEKYLIRLENASIEKAEDEARATAKAALLTQLGITEEQAKLLLS